MRILTLTLGLVLLVGPTAALAAPAELTLCGAGRDGRYTQAAAELANDVRGSINITVVESPGSEANLKRMTGVEVTDLQGKALPACGGAVVQSDSIPYFKKTYPGTPLRLERVSALFPEAFQLVCNKDAGIEKIKDLYGTKHKIAIGPNGSGTSIMFSNFVGAEKRYGTIGLEPLGGTFAVNRVKSGELACAAFTGSLGYGVMKTLNDESTGNLRLVQLNDGDLVNPLDERGKPLYRWSTVSGRVYPNLYNGWTSLDTVSQDAILVVTTAWAEANENAYRALSAAASRRAQAWGVGK